MSLSTTSSPADGQETAALVLDWIARTDDLLMVFLGSTGMSVQDLRRDMASPDLLAGILDFLLMDDAWVQRFCNEAGLPFDAPMRARQQLPGGQAHHWT